MRRSVGNARGVRVEEYDLVAETYARFVANLEPRRAELEFVDGQVEAMAAQCTVLTLVDLARRSSDAVIEELERTFAGKPALGALRQLTSLPFGSNELWLVTAAEGVTAHVTKGA